MICSTGSLGLMQEDISEVHSQETPVKFPSHWHTPSTQPPWPERSRIMGMNKGRKM